MKLKEYNEVVERARTALANAGAWDESRHPRDRGGKFAKGAGGEQNEASGNKPHHDAGNSVFMKIKRSALPDGFYQSYSRANSEAITRMGELSKKGKLPVSVSEIKGYHANFVEFKYDDGSVENIYGKNLAAIKKWSDDVGLTPDSDDGLKYKYGSTSELLADLDDIDQSFKDGNTNGDEVNVLDDMMKQADKFGVRAEIEKVAKRHGADKFMISMKKTVSSRRA